MKNLKKKIIAASLLCVLTANLIGFTGCSSDNSNSVENSSILSSSESSYASKYDFYNDSVEILSKNMKLTDEEADKVFGVLLENGLDDEITYCFESTDKNKNTYYKVWWGLNKLDVYLKDNAVDKIISSGSVIYENGKVVESETEEATEAEEVTEPTTKATTKAPTETPTERTTEPHTEEATTAVATEPTAEIVVTSLTSSVNAGDTASISMSGAPNTEYSIIVRYSSGKATAAGLEAKTSDSSGNVSWSWKVGAKTKSGTYPITISGGGKSASAEFTVN